MPAAVAFNALPLRPHGAGVSTYIREILASLVPLVAGEMVAAVSEEARAELPDGVVAALRPTASGLRRAAQGLRRPAPARVVHGLDVDLPMGSASSLVTTVHDLSVFDVPWAFPAARVAAERLLVTQAVRRADVVIAVSAFTAERIKAVLGRDAVVIHEAPPSGMVRPSSEEVDRVRRRYDLPDRFVLHVGTIEPRKNVDSLAEACRGAAVPLVAVGAIGWIASPPPGVIVPGLVPSEDLPGLYAAATLTAYASVYEGFGLPPLEAMACGSPVVSTPVPSVELLGDAPLVVRSGRASDLARGISELLADDDQRRARSASGVSSARKLRWADAAAATASVYQQLGVDLRRSTAPTGEVDPTSLRCGPLHLGDEIRAAGRALACRALRPDPRRSLW